MGTSAPSAALTRWLASQARMGVGAEALRQWALGAGCAPQDVDCALAICEQEGAFEHRGAKAARLAEQGRWRLPGGASCRLWMRCPDLALFDDIVPASEARSIVESARAALSPSRVAGGGPAPGRASQSKTFAPGECEAADRLRAGLAGLLGLPLARMEPLQATLYGPGGFYAPHHDHFAKGHARWGGPAQRVATVVAYLEEPEEGGQTVVEPLGLRVAPRAGSALYFAYPDEAARALCLHASRPCSGGKWVATQWVLAG